MGATDTAMLLAVMRHIRNGFDYRLVRGRFEIEGGVLSLPKPQALAGCNFAAIRGSRHNDGLHAIETLFDLVQLLPAGGKPATDEAFDGVVYGLSVPADFLQIVEHIVDFDAVNTPSDIVSESFGGYSYTKAQGDTGGGAWQKAFAESLHPYRRMHTKEYSHVGTGFF